MKVLKKECDIYFTVDTTEYTVDTTFITADRVNSDCFLDGSTYYTLLFVPRFKIPLTNVLTVDLIDEMTNKRIDFDFSWSYSKDFIRLKFDTDKLRDESRYSIEIKDSDKVIYLGKAIKTLKEVQDYKYSEIINNKLYI